MTLQELALAACVVTAATPALAADTVYGRWAADMATCTDENAVLSPLVVTLSALQWPDTICTIRTSYRVGDAMHISARCEDAATDIAVKLQLRGARLVIDSYGALTELRRCP